MRISRYLWEDFQQNFWNQIRQRLHNSTNDQVLQFACSASPLSSTSPASEENRSTGEASPIGFFLSQPGLWHCECEWPLALLFMLGAFVGLTWKPTDPDGNLARSECATGEGIAEDMVVFHICVFPPSNLREEQWGQGFQGGRCFQSLSFGSLASICTLNPNPLVMTVPILVNILFYSRWLPLLDCTLLDISKVWFNPYLFIKKWRPQMIFPVTTVSHLGVTPWQQWWCCWHIRRGSHCFWLRASSCPSSTRQHTTTSM